MSGTNFGLNDSLEYTEFQLDSFDCTQSYNSSYNPSDWPKFYLGKPLNNVAAMKIIEAQIPFTFYIFNKSNNAFILNEWITGGTVNSGARTVTIAPGNYNYLTIINALNTALNNASANLYAYSTIYNQSTLKLSISNNNATAGNFFSFTFGSLGDNGNTNPRLPLGFSGGLIYSSVNTGVANTAIMVAPDVIQLSGENYIYINSRTIGPLIKVFLPGNGILNPVASGADGPQIAKIPMTVNAGMVYNWADPNPLMWFDMGNTTFSGSLDIYVTLGTNPAPLLFNGDSFSIKLGLLTNTSSHNDWLGGGRQNNRAVAKTWPTGMQF